MGYFKFKGFPGSGSFSHGVHPPDSKFYSADAAVEVMPVPEKVVLPVLQHIGAPCEPVVKPKQKVLTGELVGAGKAFVSASLHSPISGIVQKMSVVTLPNGRHLPAINIKAEGDQIDPQTIWDDLRHEDWPVHEIETYDPDEISRRIHGSGIVGLGGAAFPTHVKVMPDDRKMIDTVMVNGCECEPYLTPDYRVMVEMPDAVITGALLACRAVTSKELIICIEDNKPEAVKSIQLAIDRVKQRTRYTNLKLAVLKTKYPQGSEKQLIKAVLDLEVPLGGLPSDVGVAMSNVGTMAAIARGYVQNKPLTHRVISVSGAGIKHPGNLFVPVGISAGEVLDFCGGVTQNAARLISGGPMMGFSFSDLSTPVTKGTSGITVLTHDEISSGEETACVRCGKCVEACPMNLVPTRLAMAARYKKPVLAAKYNINACFECGCCTYACPANIKLVQLIRIGKAQVAASRKSRI